MASKDVELLRLPPVFMMDKADKERIYSNFEFADAIYTQRISQEYGIDWMSTQEVRQAFGDKVTVWPNIYFDGYFPGVRYIYLSKWGKLLSPLGEYHFDQVHRAHGAGKTVEEAVEAFAGETLFDATPDPIAELLERLRSREADVDVPISDVIEDGHARSRQFYTPNHPVNELLAAMLQRLADRTGLAFNSGKAATAPYRLDECYIATSPAIVRRFELPFDQNTIYRGREVIAVEPYAVTLGEPRDYDIRSLVETFYRLYDAVRAHG